MNDPLTALHGLLAMSMVITNNSHHWFNAARDSGAKGAVEEVARLMQVAANLQAIANHELLALDEPLPDDCTEKIMGVVETR